MLKPYNRAEITFDLIREIGQVGRNSQTYIAHDHQLDAEIVTKQISKANLDSPENFFDESKALYASAHPNVVQIHYACEDPDCIYLAMPYYRRGSVTSLINNRYMTVREIVAIGCQVVSALHNIHSKGLIHFDVKPDNILLSDRGEALLSDFGLAKYMNLMGRAGQDRLYYKTVPPEAIGRDQFERSFDIYQLGLTLYRMSNGDALFYNQLNAYGIDDNFDRDRFRYDLRNGRFPNRDAFLSHIPTRLRTIIKTCLEPTATDRYRSAIEVANEMADIDGPTLDWRFTDAADRRSWMKNESGTVLEFYANADESTECFKTVGGGHRRRVGEGCTPRMTERQIRSFLDTH